jgi:hypothetical protein
MEEFEGTAARRLAPRFPADLPYRLFCGTTVVAEGTLLDISMSGAAVVAPQPVPAAEGYHLRLEDPGGAWVLDVPARLVTVDPDPFGGYVVRLRFELEFEVARSLAYVVTALRSHFNLWQATIAGERIGMHGAAHLHREDD